MSDDAKPTTLEAIEARRAARREKTAAAKAVQYVLDMEQLDKLEEKHGDGAVKALHAPSHTAGLPTMVIVKSPAASAYKRFQDLVREAKGHQGAIAAAAEQLARACIVYPDAAQLAAMVEAYPNTMADAANAAAAFVQLQTEAEKKG